ncbi:hypothetical protein BP6252_06786 [Coleophoma cylindrospora]|uniref:Zn(2)-C6 fungal-type domain-containing protein n=1 Tax=Coleophoma cylindrospora TaxID=1849047 RepID=A0A3D8RFQ2_9HELO|nr:hypothetical protein BP6252_06786 [Coleophoma cylindrospora]
MPPSSQSLYTKLRTKKGCVTCRQRRKKCDERKPTCVTCERLGFECDWPDLAALVDRRERGALNSRWSSSMKSRHSIARCSKTLSRISSKSTAYFETEVTAPNCRSPISSSGILSTAQCFARSNREVLLLTYYYQSYLPANILPKAHADFSKAYVVDVPELTDIMYACSAMQWANRYNSSPIESLYYHARAVSGLRKRLESGKVTGLEDWLLAITILLHTFETWRCASDKAAPSALQHLLGAIQLLKLRCTSIVAKEQHKFNVLIAESVLFHISTLLASGTFSTTTAVDSTVWDWIEIILEKPAYDNVTPPANHPVLGTPRKLNRLIFKISQLSVRNQLTADDMLVAEALGVELQKWEVDDEHDTLDNGIPFQKDPYDDQPILLPTEASLREG